MAASLNRVNQQGPGGSVSYSQNGDQWTQTTALSPEQQALYEQQLAVARGAAGGAQQRLGQVAGMAAPDFSGLPNRVTGVGATPYQTNINAPSVGRTSLDFSGAPGLTNDFSAERQRVEDSLYGSATSRLDPQFSQNEESLRTRLLNSGIREGSEAWANEMQRAAWEKQDAYGNARDRAIQGGGAEQSRLFADALARRQQAVGETATAGNFENQAAAQQFGNEAVRAGLYNSGQDQRFAQGATNAALQNQGRDAGISEQLTQRSLPLQELLQLYGISAGPGALPTSPVPQAPGAEPADIYGATRDQYQNAMSLYNAQQARNAGMWGGLLNAGASLGGAAILASDRRLKTDIEPLARMSNGLELYAYRYINDPVRRMGVMADEVRALYPDAVHRGADGFDRVDYAAIGLAGLGLTEPVVH